jgi:hypothetical protein
MSIKYLNTLISSALIREDDIKDIIGVDHFNLDDILRCVCISGKIHVKFRNLNGTIPIHFFTDKAQNRIRGWIRMQNSPLGKTLRGKK